MHTWHRKVCGAFTQAAGPHPDGRSTINARAENQVLDLALYTRPRKLP